MKKENIVESLTGREFLILATVDAAGQPNAVPKFFLKVSHPYIYLIDYAFAKNIENLRGNPKASIGLIDLDNLEGCRVNGIVELIEHGPEFLSLTEELDKKLIKLSADRVIDGSKTGIKSEHFELEFPDKFIVIKFKIADITKVGPSGNLYKENDVPVVQ